MNNKRWNAVWINCLLATMENNGSPYGMIENAAIAIEDNNIAWLGPLSELPGDAKHVYDVKGKCVTPGLIDCHTHLVYAGNRCKEFELRLQGATYADIAKAGGGIRSTVMATRQASEAELLEQSLKRARALIAEGVTTLEIKSGYGLDLPTEIKILRVAQKIGAILPVSIFTTFLGAHALPPEFQNNADDYIDFVCEKMLPVIVEEKLANAIDVFCEKIAFNLQQTEKMFATARHVGLSIKCHAEQLSDSGAAELAANYNAMSVDHLEFISEKSIQALARAGTVAVLLPGAFYFLRETQKPPIELLRRYKIPMAIATDCNPGTSPIASLLLIMNMACTLYGLTPEESLLGATKYAARALGLDKKLGTLKVGKIADFVIWDIQHPAELSYQVGFNSCLHVIKNGVSVK